jgi:MFS transporter, ACS family, tartrate transporter
MHHAARSAIAKAARRLLPFLILCYAVNFLDRVNVGFAALAMNEDLGFSPSVFGTGAGIFFVGYLLFEIPSNLALQRFGARIWIARIMVSWGIIATAMALVGGETSFYVMRFLLGVAEAGFFPGIILYLTYWFPARERARIVSLFMAAVPLATLVGGPSPARSSSCTVSAGSRGGIGCSLSRGCPRFFLGSSRSPFSTTSPSKRAGCQARNARHYRGCLPMRRRRRGRRATTHSAMR